MCEISGQAPAGAFVVLVLVSLMSFAIIWLVPGDPTAAFLDTSATPEQVARLRQRTRSGQADRRCRCSTGTARILRGDLGHSILLNRSVTAAIVERLPVTLSLAGLALVFALVMGVARRRRGRGSSQPLARSGRDDRLLCLACPCRISGSADHADPALRA